MSTFAIFCSHGRKSSVIIRHFPSVRTEIYKHIIAIFLFPLFYFAKLRNFISIIGQVVCTHLFTS